MLFPCRPATGGSKFTGIGARRRRVAAGVIAGARASTVAEVAQEAEWGGYSGYFADLDGFLWEVAWNPHLDLT